MALRIKPKDYNPPQAPVDEPIEEELPVEEPMAPATPEMLPMLDAPIQGGGQVDPESARYFTSEHSCSGCIHFMEPGSCEIVSGEIDPEGICSLYVPDAEALGAEPTLDTPVEEPLTEDLPLDEEE